MQAEIINASDADIADIHGVAPGLDEDVPVTTTPRSIIISSTSRKLSGNR